MVKFTLIPLMFALLPASNANAAHMTTKERVAVAKRLERAAPFVQEKYLPASFVKEVEKNMKSDEDKAQLKKLNADWSKHYSKNIKTRVTGNSFHVTYKGASLINVKVASLKPFTIQINKSKEAVIRSGSYFADMSAAMKAAGYDFSAKKKSAWLQLLPEAYAEGEVALKTVENSVFLLGGTVYELNEDGTLKTAMDKTSARTDWKSVFGDGNLDNVICSGDNMTGKFKFEGSEVPFFISRQTGLKMTIDGINIKGDIKQNNVTEMCAYAEGAKSKEGLSQEYVAQVRNNHVLVCKALVSLRPAAGLNCKQDESAEIDHFKSECAKMSAIGLVANFDLERCTDADCKAFADIPMKQGDFKIETIAELHGYLKFQEEVKRVAGLIETVFAKEINAGQIKKVGDAYVVVPPDKMGARRALEFVNTVKQIPTAPTAQAGKPAVNFRDMSTAVAGLLDCCYDTKCKVDLLQKSNIEMVPAESTN